MMKKIMLLLAAISMMLLTSLPAQAVPNEIEKHCHWYWNPPGTRNVQICEALEQSTPDGDTFWGRVYVQNAGQGTNILPPYRICCTVTLWETDLGSSNYDVATAGTVLWNQGDGDQDYNTSHLDKSNLKCKVHVEAGGASTGNLAITWQQGNDPHYITDNNNSDVSLGNYGKNC